jgi:hypothetical protein
MLIAREILGAMDVSAEGAERMLLTLHDDYAALRRYLVDEGFLSRDHGEYWRSGGTVEL